jgi:spore coat protein CotF
MTDTKKLRMLINRVDAIMRKISLGTYETQPEIRAALRDALQKTGAWVH